MKSEDSNNNREVIKRLHELIQNFLDSEDDDLDNELLEKVEQQIVMDKGRDKVDLPVCEDFIDALSIPQYKFPYKDYRIIGDTAEIDTVINTCGMINIDVADITSTLSTDTLNYVTVGIGGNIEDALKQSVDNLPITTGQVEKMLFQILVPKDYKPDLSAPKSIANFIRKYDKDIDVCWGVAFGESLIDNIKVVLIASSK